MINITESARKYFTHLIGQQDEEGLALRISVDRAGTPGASCDLQFCPAGQNMPDDSVAEFEGFRLYVARASETWLEKAEIDFEEDATGGQLTIKAPGIKGSEPPVEARLEERINWLLETEINPALAAHGGRVRLVEITEEMQAVLQFGGGCHGCGMADVTLKQGIEQTLTRRIPEIRGVLDATDHRSGKNPYYASGVQGKSAV
jgi:Fe/S biogenesis protein NfuA